MARVFNHERVYESLGQSRAQLFHRCANDHHRRLKLLDLYRRAGSSCLFQVQQNDLKLGMRKKVFIPVRDVSGMTAPMARPDSPHMAHWKSSPTPATMPPHCLCLQCGRNTSTALFVQLTREVRIYLRGRRGIRTLPVMPFTCEQDNLTSVDIEAIAASIYEPQPRIWVNDRSRCPQCRKTNEHRLRAVLAGSAGTGFLSLESLRRCVASLR